MTRSADVGGQVDHLFRRCWGRMVTALVRTFGPSNLDLAETVVQDALLRALETWPYQGIPDDPEAWLYRVARNRVVDHLRRDGRSIGLSTSSDAGERLDPFLGPFQSAESLSEAGLDDELAMIFICCHPSISTDSQVALTLRTVGGLGVDEIASAFLVDPEAMKQRLVRARRNLRENDVVFELPVEAEMARRMETVLHVLYLMFNEGYSATDGDSVIRGELCQESIRLGRLLDQRDRTRDPRLLALLALFHFQASRLPARVDESGGILVLEDQDRALWDQGLVAEGMRYLQRSASGAGLSAYHLEAGIASVHAAARSFEETDWPRILSYYDSLVEIAPSPVIELNRLVARAMIEGPESGLEELELLSVDPRMGRYALLPAVRAALLQRAGRLDEACDVYEAALARSASGPGRDFLFARLETCRKLRSRPSI